MNKMWHTNVKHLTCCKFKFQFKYTHLHFTCLELVFDNVIKRIKDKSVTLFFGLTKDGEEMGDNITKLAHCKMTDLKSVSPWSYIVLKLNFNANGP